MGGRRVERVSSVILREVAAFVERKIKNPAIGFVTVTGVRLSEDLRHAKVSVVCRGDEEERGTSMRILTACIPAIRRELKEVLTIRWIPSLAFEEDPSFDHAEKIQSLLNEIDIVDEEDS